MKFQRFEVPGLAHYSYLIGCGGRAAVVDPRRDAEVYRQYAAENGLRITHVLETHIHADYASGALELARDTGAELWLSRYDRGEDFEYQFPHREFSEGEELRVGNALLRAVHTPGHTPEHLSFVVHDLARGAHPLALLSGDFVFVGSLGRPDLLGEQAKRRLAEQLYESLFTRIAFLPDGVEVHPAHGAGSLCGSGMSERPQSTLGYERLANTFFGLREKQKFIEHILATVPPFPDYYRRMKRVNSAGPRILRGLPGGETLAPTDFRELLRKEGAVVIDLRRPEAFGAVHIPGSINIGLGPTFAFWAPWVVPYERPLLLVGDDGAGDEEARRGLVRVGLDEVRGSLRGGMRAWVEAGFEQAQLPQISVGELRARVGNAAYVLDVRMLAEWTGGHIAGAHHIMAGELLARLKEIPRNQPLHVICGSGYRSSIAASLLKRAGFADVTNVTGGMNAWQKQGFPTSAAAPARRI